MDIRATLHTTMTPEVTLVDTGAPKAEGGSRGFGDLVLGWLQPTVVLEHPLGADELAPRGRAEPPAGWGRLVLVGAAVAAVPFLAGLAVGAVLR